jgi:hypothetical protein
LFPKTKLSINKLNKHAMRKIYLIVLALSYAFNITGQTRSDSIHLRNEYGFDKYKTMQEQFKISDKELIFAKGTKNFNTRIKAALKENVNFAGHCIFLYWGCGMECQQSAIIDTKTKKVIFGPNAPTGFIYYPDSRLLVSNPKDTGAADIVLKKTYIYIWENDSLKLLRTQEW